MDSSLDEVVTALESQLTELEDFIPVILANTQQYNAYLHDEKYQLSEDVETRKLKHFEGAVAYLGHAFAINSLFYTYLRTQGVDGGHEPLQEELSRIKNTYAQVVNIQKSLELVAEEEEHVVHAEPTQAQETRSTQLGSSSSTDAKEDPVVDGKKRKSDGDDRSKSKQKKSKSEKRDKKKK
mmetsp:Transcript_18230/g.31602  ORF Transcript_18230/g.31602 Transcript_18230/m.31602 type:complete len:181 (-) Transcript_18230:167-709(-)|eukprot:CAMPEP_0184694222 /NCGR_PEP_ID=MMETSP0313-20130426/2252_1 /TAXON_ID=2792 /ORGANISM="Porphyridium aerugineum, Strain SAG 1380-2" /LENGTH=180 /DNA_ID=CAMNT_0027152479 /DNA_START=45 /DNA_END=587 /DNA_ORIENTATION=-